MVPVALSDAEAITLGIAGYAAIVSTLALGIQLASFLLGWRTRVEIKVSAKELLGPNQDPESVILMELVNHGDWPVKISSVAFMPQKLFPRLRRNLSWFVIGRPFPVEEPLPIQIPAHDSKLIWVKPANMTNALNLDKRVRVQIATTTGKAFRSKRSRLDFSEAEGWTGKSVADDNR